MPHRIVLDEEGKPHTLRESIAFLNMLEQHIIELPVTRKDTIRISTVFLGIPRGTMHSDVPMLYETTVFADEAIIARLLEFGVDIRKRYATRDEALQGHTQTCEFIDRLPPRRSQTNTV